MYVGSPMQPDEGIKPGNPINADESISTQFSVFLQAKVEFDEVPLAKSVKILEYFEIFHNKLKNEFSIRSSKFICKYNISITCSVLK